MAEHRRIRARRSEGLGGRFSRPRGFPQHCADHFLTKRVQAVEETLRSWAIEVLEA